MSAFFVLCSLSPPLQVLLKAATTEAFATHTTLPTIPTTPLPRKFVRWQRDWLQHKTGLHWLGADVQCLHAAAEVVGLGSASRSSSKPTVLLSLSPPLNFSLSIHEKMLPNTTLRLGLFQKRGIRDANMLPHPEQTLSAITAIFSTAIKNQEHIIHFKESPQLPRETGRT